MRFFGVSYLKKKIGEASRPETFLKSVNPPPHTHITGSAKGKKFRHSKYDDPVSWFIKLFISYDEQLTLRSEI